MPTFFQRPENALKRANEFIDVGKKQRALDALYDVIKSKKHRTWQKIHEPIMEKYLELCVELKKSHLAKEGLYQYKNICQQVNIKSLEDVVRKYLTLAEEKTEAARQESHQVVVDIDDLDILQTPESLLLSAVSGEDTQDRTDRAILTPWVKFLWESYRQCLDLLRNNSSVEKLYQDIAQQAFKFCLKYTRKTEFRKLCDNLRTHLGHIHKHQHQQRAINLNNPESQAMHLETRLVQLDSAIQMELWQEAFKAVEDIHGLISLSKKPPKPALMANYYQKLGLVFWKSGNHMFHACAWHRLFHLSREQRKNISQEELQRMSSRVVCATLAIPIRAGRGSDSVLDLDDNTLEKQRRLATLLGLNNPPTRQGLVKDLVKYNVVQHVYPELSNLYEWMEVTFHPLKLAGRVEAPLGFIAQKEELSQYVCALQDIVIHRILKQVSQLYQTIEFSRLQELIPFATKFHLERVIVDAAKNLDLQVRVDHRSQSLSFGTVLATSADEDSQEGPHLQSMPSETIRNQLINLAQVLEKAMAIIQPKTQKMKRDELRAHIIQSYRQTAKKDHQRILMRRQIIEERKEELENMNTQREQEEMAMQEEQRRRQYEAEMARLEREAEERERQRRMKERQEIQRKAAKEKLEQLKSTAIGAKVFADMDVDVIAELDPDEIMAKQVEQLEKEKKEMQEKLRQQEKKVDYYERAKRLEEIPLLEKQYEELKTQSRQFWEQQEQQRIEQMKADREIAISQRDRLSRITEDKDAFLAKLKAARMSVYKENLKEFEKKLNEERKKRLAERKERRKEERRMKYYKEKEEEEQRKADEEAKRKREEQERMELEAREKEEEEYRERLRKLEEIAEKQRQKEKEIEEREMKRRDESSTQSRGLRGRDDDWRRGGGEERDRDREPDWRRGGDRERDQDRGSGGAWRPKIREGGWREREKAREESWKRPQTRDEDAGQDEADSSREPRDDVPDRDQPDERGPPADDRGSSWRDRERRDASPPRDSWRRGGGRDDDRRGPPGEGGSWRDRERGMRDRDIGGGGGGGWRDRGPREDRGFRDREDRGGWGRDRRDEDRFGSRDERGGGGWRREGGDRGMDRDRGGMRDDWRRGGDDRRPPRDDDRRPPRDDDRRPPRDDDRRPPRDDDRRPPRDDDRRRDDYGPPRDREERWRGGGGGRDGGAGRDDWRGDRDRGDRDRGDRDRGDRPPPRDDGPWRRGGDDRGPPRDSRPPPRDEGPWRRGEARGSPSKGRDDREERPERGPRRTEDSDGWTTIKR